MAREHKNNLSYTRQTPTPRSPLQQLDDNRMNDSDDNTDNEGSPCPSTLAITPFGRQNVKSAKKLASEQMRQQEMVLSSQPKFYMNFQPKQINFSPKPTVKSFYAMSSPSKLHDENLLQRNRTPEQTPEKVESRKAEHSVASTPQQRDNGYDYRQEEGDDWEDEQQTPQQATNVTIRDIFWDPMTPFIVSGYIQNGFNLFVLGCIIYFFFIFFQTVRHDVDMKIEEYSAEIMAEIAVCSQNYIQNNCMPGRRVPALDRQCNQWEKCKNRDPAIVGRAKVGAETFGEIFNGFLKPISWKSMIFMVVFVGGTIVLSNLALFYTRKNLQPPPPSPASSQEQHQQQQQQQTEGQTPRTPRTQSKPVKTPGTRYYTPRRALPSARKKRTAFKPL